MTSHIEVVKALMTDHDYQNVNIRTVDLWMLMCACQAMVVNPALHEGSYALYRDLGKRLQAIVVAIHPEAKELADRGWDTFVGTQDDDDLDNQYHLPFWGKYTDDDGEYGGDDDE